MNPSVPGRRAASHASFLLRRAGPSSSPQFRSFSQSIALRDDVTKPQRPAPATNAAPAGPAASKGPTESLLEQVWGPSAGGSDGAAQRGSAMSNLSSSIVFDTINRSKVDTSILDRPQAGRVREDDLEPFHMHVYSHKHNCHITVTRPNREPIISLSSGNLGYKKARRGLYDSAYSTTKYVFERLIHMGWQPKIRKLELVLRGFGQGREAAVKVLMSPEGKAFRDKIVRVADSTRIKFGGTRSQKPKRR